MHPLMQLKVPRDLEKLKYEADHYWTCEDVEPRFCDKDVSDGSILVSF